MKADSLAASLLDHASPSDPIHFPKSWFDTVVRWSVCGCIILYWLLLCDFQRYRTRCKYIKQHSFSVGNKNTFCGTVCTVVDILIFKHYPGRELILTSTVHMATQFVTVDFQQVLNWNYTNLKTVALTTHSFRHFCRRIDVPFSHNTRRCRRTDRRQYDANRPSVQYYRLKRVLCCQPCPLVGWNVGHIRSRKSDP